MRQIKRFNRKTINFSNNSTEKMVERLRNSGWTRRCKYREYCDIKDGKTRYNGKKHTVKNSFYGEDRLKLLNLRSTAYSMYICNGDPKKNKGKIILDAGCGKSPDVMIAVEQDGFKKGYRMDLLPFFYSNDDKNIQNVLGDICEPWKGIKPNSLDVIISQAVLDLMDAPDRDLFYKNAYKYLKKGGVLMVYFVHLSCGWGYDFPDEYHACESIGFEIAQKYTNQLFKAIKK